MTLGDGDTELMTGDKELDAGDQRQETSGCKQTTGKQTFGRQTFGNIWKVIDETDKLCMCGESF